MKAVFTIALCGLLFTPEAGAHGEHNWVRQGGYKNWRGHGCCGVHDCRTLASHQWAWRPDGSAVDLWNGESVARQNILPSETGDVVRCIYRWDPNRFVHDPPGTQDEGRTRCLFLPMKTM